MFERMIVISLPRAKKAVQQYLKKAVLEAEKKSEFVRNMFGDIKRNEKMKAVTKRYLRSYIIRERKYQHAICNEKRRYFLTALNYRAQKGTANELFTLTNTATSVRDRCQVFRPRLATAARRNRPRKLNYRYSILDRRWGQVCRLDNSTSSL